MAAESTKLFGWIDLKQIAITAGTVILALIVYERWVGPMIAKKVS
jgi:hypothetical protein